MSPLPNAHASQQDLARLFSAATQDGRLTATAALEQIATLVFLALLDAREGDRQAAAAEDRTQPPLFAQQSARYRWSQWRTLRGEKLANFVNGEVLPYMASLSLEAPAIAEYFRDVSLRVADPETLEFLVDRIDAMAIGRHPADEQTDIFTTLIRQMVQPSSSVQSGDIRAPTELQSLMLELAGPTASSTILDPACQFGGLLLAAVRTVRDQPQPVTTDDSPNAVYRTLVIDGMEPDTARAHIATVRLALANVDRVRIRAANALTHEGALFIDERIYDVVVCHPPFGLRYVGPLAPTVANDLRTSSGDLLFLSRIVNALAPGGMGVVLVPENVLFGRSRAHVAMRSHLLDAFEVLAVISLPLNALENTRIHTSILAIRRPSSSDAGTNRVWFYSLARYDGSDWSHSVTTLRKLWQSYRESDFQVPPGTNARDTESANVDTSPDALSYFWVTRKEIRPPDFALNIGRYLPHRSSDRDSDNVWKEPDTLINEALALEEQIADKLRALLASPSDAE